MSSLTLIVAATKTNGIGQNARLPWRLPKEMAYFARVTSNAPEGHINAVIMGRNTWESIPTKFRPLSKRVNVVVSRQPNYALTPSEHPVPNSPVYLCPDLSTAMNQLSESNFKDKPIHRRFIIGGASLYSETLALPRPTLSSESAFVERVLLTRIISPAFEDCDVFMPDFMDENEDKKETTEWRRATHDALRDWSELDVPKGVQEENGVKYEFQMWMR